MRILVVDIAASSGGALSILTDFYDYIKENDTKNEWYFLLGDRYIEETKHIHIETFPEIKQSRMRRLLFEFFGGKNIVKKYNPDIIFSLQNTFIHGTKVPQTLYVHQPLPFQKIKKFSFIKNDERPYAVYQYLIGRIIKNSIKKSDYIIVQTEWMKKAVIDQTKKAESKVCVIPPTVKIDYSEHKNKWCDSSFFYPTSDVIYKNIGCIEQAVNILEQKGYNPDVVVTVEGDKHSKGINCIGHISRQEVINNYTKRTLVFPSYIETFGLPLLEARKIGTVILASDCPFSREILHGYENAYFFNPFKPDELARLMTQVMDGEIKKKNIIVGKESIENSNTWGELISYIER